MAIDAYITNFGPFNKQGWGTAAPSLSTDGTWQRGDVIWNTEPSAGGDPGWVCTTGGTPGTWKAMADLDA
jgi:hypothetical protein